LLLCHEMTSETLASAWPFVFDFSAFSMGAHQVQFITNHPACIFCYSSVKEDKKSFSTEHIFWLSFTGHPSSPALLQSVSCLPVLFTAHFHLPISAAAVWKAPLTP
jgi:hypothetical protein